ncbi:MAG: response regulator [Methylovulum sp.]|nr:response regulator [Methylovulum sp.]
MNNASFQPITKTPAILFVDDEPNILKSLQRLFRSVNYDVYTAESGLAGLAIVKEHRIDVIVSDMRMPHMDGAEFLEHIANEAPDIIRILLTGYSDIQSTIAAVNKGKIYSYLSKPWEDNELKIQLANAIEQKHLREERQQLFIIINQQNAELKDLNTNLEEKIHARTAQLKTTLNQLDSAHKLLEKQYADTVLAFAKIIEMRPGIKSGQSKYIAEKAVQIGRELGVAVDELKNLLYAGMLKQIGKMSLPDQLLAKPFYALSTQQKKEYLLHTIEGEALLKDLQQLHPASVLIRHQHEQYDGLGYPDALKHHNIPLGSRILKVISDYVACLDGSLTGTQMTVGAALSWLNIRKENHYDPNVIDAFIKVLKETEPEKDFEIDPLALDKSWKTSSVITENPHHPDVSRPVLEISWSELKVGMEVEGVYFNGKAYIKNCIVTEKILQGITKLKYNLDLNPNIKIRIGKLTSPEK